MPRYPKQDHKVFDRPVALHPEVHKRLRVMAAEEDQTIQETVHIILCQAVGLEHLLMQAPDEPDAVSA